MQILIPMSGMSQRFINAGYESPKFLVDVDQKPMILNILDLFPQNSKFIFFINEFHYKKTNIVNLLNSLELDLKILKTPIHKLGPGHTIRKFYDHISDTLPTIVNYCDFSMGWNFEKFQNYVNYFDLDGCILTYKGFHPHMLHDNNYAFCKVNKSNDLLEIKEKESFTDNKMSEHASSGAYYFKNGKIMKNSIEYLFQNNDRVNGEYYISLAYKFLISKKLKTKVYEIDHMLQWGTPKDLEEYKYWSNMFKKFIYYKNDLVFDDFTTLLPMAGIGHRFSKDGIKTHKPLLPINSKNMYEQALKCLPKTKKTFLGVLKDKDIFESRHSKVLIKKLLQGQACTVEKMINEIKPKGPLLIASCDNGAMINQEELTKLIRKDYDIIVWTYKGSFSNVKNPNMYSWVNLEKNKVLSVDVKNFKNRGNPMDFCSIVGTFIFKSSEIYLDSLKQLYQDNITTNGEFYIDNLINSAIKLGYNVNNFIIDDYICWGTPNDYNTFQYWQSFFKDYKNHIYNIKECFFTK